MGDMDMGGRTPVWERPPVYLEHSASHIYESWDGPSPYELTAMSSPDQGSGRPGQSCRPSASSSSRGRGARHNQSQGLPQGALEGPPQAYTPPYDPRYAPHPAQYTISAPMAGGLAHTSPPYPYPPIPQQNLHPNFRQPQGYPQFQRHSPDAGLTYTPGPSTNYGHHMGEPMQPLGSPAPPTGPPVVYPAPQFQSFNRGYNYGPQFSSTPSYQSQYATPAYPPQYPQAPQEIDGQLGGTWVYLPRMPRQPTQYDGAAQQSYQPPPQFNISYPIGRGTDPSHSPVALGSAPSYASALKQTGFSESSMPSPGQPPVVSSPSPSSASGNKAAGIRRSYHPNPPANQTEWVMWAGNVPPDSTHDELWRFLSQSLPVSPSSEKGLSQTNGGGVVSIFLISRSSCAFVNYDSEVSLARAIERFDGLPIRTQDPRCPRLVCRVRRKDDDLKAGVGAQRGMGIHKRWIRDQKMKEQDDIMLSLSEPSPQSDSLSSGISSISVSDDSENSSGPKPHSNSSGSFASTTSSALARHFPVRFFILKSLTQFDLDLSVEKGLWATQRHNEGILDQAYRTSKEVYLIFSVNKSGEFYGYAKMDGPVRHGEHRVLWASRAGDSPSSRASAAGSRVPESLIEEEPEHAHTTSPPPLLDTPGHHSIYDSPLPLTDTSQILPLLHGRSAPAILGPPPRNLTMETPPSMRSLDVRPGITSKSISTIEPTKPIELDPSAPLRAVRHPELLDPEAALLPVAEEEEKSDAGSDVHRGQAVKVEVSEEGWGESFRIKWLCTERLPFHRARNIRNPWNNDREIKVSRDGTELEPKVGQELLALWQLVASEPAPIAAISSKGQSSANRRGTTTRSAPASPPSTKPHHP